MSRILHALLLVGGIAAAVPAVAEPLVVIVDRDNPASDISLEELKSYFTGKRKEWPDGARAVPIDLEPGASERKIFEKAALGMSTEEYERWWVDQRVRGQGNAPRAVPATSAVKLAARARGVLAYVRASQADASVKVLKVNGIAPGAAGYPIEAP